MLEEFSCGAVVFSWDADRKTPLFVLVFSKRNQKWGFPKGHIENGETEIDAAKREIFEETGVKDVKFTEGFHIEDVYEIEGVLPKTKGEKVLKHSIYFLAETENFNFAPTASDDEISEIKFLSFEDALAKLPFENQKEILKKARKKITGK